MAPKAATEGKDFCIRLDLNGTDRKSIDKRLAEWADKQQLTMIGCHEYPHDNYHYHLWCHSIRILKVPALRASFLKALPELKGNKSYSFVAREGGLLYICKGPLTISDSRKSDFPGERQAPEIVFNTMGVTPDEIIQAHDDWWNKYGTVELSKIITNGSEKDKETMLSAIYNSIPDKKAAAKWDHVQCGMYVMSWYLDKTRRRMTVDHFGRSLQKGLWIMLGDRKQANLRMAKIAHQWCKGLDDYYDSNFKATDYMDFLDKPEWDPIEKDTI